MRAFVWTPCAAVLDRWASKNAAPLFAIGFVILCSGTAEAQRFQRNAPNFLRAETFTVGTDRIVVSPVGGARCAANLSIRIQAPLRSFFANQQRQVSILWPDVLSYLRQNCPEIEAVDITGYGQTITTYRGKASAFDGWTLQHQQTPLTMALEDLGRARATFDNVRALDNILSKHSDAFGGGGTSDANDLRARIEERKSQLAGEQIARLETEAQQIPETVEGLNRIGRHGQREYEILRRSYPQHVSRLDDVIKRREVAIRDGALLEFEKQLREAPKGVKDAASTIRKAKAIQDSWGARIPELSAISGQAIRDVNQTLAGGLDAFKGEIAGYPRDWDGLKRASAELGTIRTDAAVAEGLLPYGEALAAWRTDVVRQLEEQAASEISAAGGPLDTLDAVIVTGEELAKRFGGFGETSSEGRLQDVLSRRVNAIAAANLASFEAELRSLDANHAAHSQAQQILRQYVDLARSVPAFDAYAAAAFRRVGDIRSTICSMALKEFGRSDLLQHRWVADGLDVTFGDVICAVHVTGGKVSVDSGLWNRAMSLFSAKVVTTVDDYNGQRTQITLQPSASPDQKPGFVGIAVQRGTDVKSLDPAAWAELARIIVQGPPDGEPDEQGRTECDLLAADPDDPGKRAPGRDWAKETDIALAERAMEACVAALEFDPEQPRLQYQLGRLLWSMGDQDQSKQLVEVAASRNYAAAQALRAEIILASDTSYSGFVDAYELLELASKSGHKPAMKLVKELNPQGLDIYKELPTPTSSDLLTALPNQCAEMFGVRTCIRFTGAQIKSCTQMNRSDFMCEWKAIASCDNNANQLVDALFRLACSQTEFEMGTFRKIADGKWQKLN